MLRARAGDTGIRSERYRPEGLGQPRFRARLAEPPPIVCRRIAGQHLDLGTDPGDSIIKLSNDGKLLWDFGHRWPKGKELKQDNQQTDLLMGIDFDDEDAHEIYVADGARNKRVLDTT